MMETQAVTTTYISRASRFEALVETAYNERNTFAGFEGTLESAVKVHFSKMSTQHHMWKRDTFKQLLLIMYAKKCYAVLRNPSYIEVLANISAFGNKTVRDINIWTKDSLVAEGQMKSLIRHCFAKYDVPAFMENVFAAESKVHMLWYIQLGRGDSVQSLCGFPVQFTARMAHEFRNTPNGYIVGKAIRRAQALGFGADENRAEAIAWSSLHESFQNEDFNCTVVQFMVNVKEEVAFNVIQHVLEYISAMRHEDASFSMKGRTWAALVRQANHWYLEMVKKREAEGSSDWKPAPIANYVVDDGDTVIRVIQLTSSSALYEEGAEMSHCVAEYDEVCQDGKTAIFSVRRYAKGEAAFETLATVEVFLEDMEIVQAKARFNEMICETTHTILSEWSHRERLAIGYEYCTTSRAALQYMGGEPVEPAFHGIVAGGQQERQLNEYARAIANRPAPEPYRAYQPYTANDNRGGGNGTEIVKIVLIIIKILIIVARCSN